MGQPDRKVILRRKQTRRTEISKYPEERKSTETLLVVTSESGPGQWSFLEKLELSGKIGQSG